MQKSGKYIFRLRKVSGLNQQQFADKIGLSRSYISQLENDAVDLSLSTYSEWIKLFDIEDVNVLFNQNKYQEKLASK
jgi:transcriptional regulator with XRE-family HTH domain